MSPIIIIMIAILIITIITGIILSIYALKNKKKSNIEPNYQVFFILGICFLPLGTIFMITIENPGFIGFTALGIIYMIIGLSHRDKWEKIVNKSKILPFHSYTMSATMNCTT